jgi:hypothetical protein
LSGGGDLSVGSRGGVASLDFGGGVAMASTLGSNVALVPNVSLHLAGGELSALWRRTRERKG